MQFNIGNTPQYKVRRQKFGIGSMLLLIAVGAAFVGAGTFAMKSSAIDETWVRTNGKVVDTTSQISDGSTIYYPVIEYQVEGKNYRISGSGGSSFAPGIGSQKELAYNPQTPQVAKAVDGSGTKVMMGSFTVIGALLILAAPIFYMRSLKRSQKISNLTANGRKVQGIITDIQSMGGGNGGNNSYRIIVAAVDLHGGTRNYTSDPLEGIAGLAMADFRNNPIPIDVYLDPTDPENYYVDISDVPNLTPQRIQELIKSAIGKFQPQSMNTGQTPTTAVAPAAPGTVPPAQPNPAGPAANVLPVVPITTAPTTITNASDKPDAAMPGTADTLRPADANQVPPNLPPDQQQ